MKSPLQLALVAVLLLFSVCATTQGALCELRCSLPATPCHGVAAMPGMTMSPSAADSNTPHASAIVNGACHQPLFQVAVSFSATPAQFEAPLHLLRDPLPAPPSTRLARLRSTPQYPLTHDDGPSGVGLRV